MHLSWLKCFLLLSSPRVKEESQITRFSYCSLSTGGRARSWSCPPTCRTPRPSDPAPGITLWGRTARPVDGSPHTPPGEDHPGRRGRRARRSPAGPTGHQWSSRTRSDSPSNQGGTASEGLQPSLWSLPH